MKNIYVVNLKNNENFETLIIKNIYVVKPIKWFTIINIDV